MCLLCEAFEKLETYNKQKMSRKTELEHERESLTRDIQSFQETITIAQNRIKFAKKRLKLVDEEISELPETVINANPTLLFKDEMSQHADQPEKDSNQTQQ